MKYKTNGKWGATKKPCSAKSLKIMGLLSAMLIFTLAIALNANAADNTCNSTSPTYITYGSQLNVTVASNRSNFNDSGLRVAWFAYSSNTANSSSIRAFANVTNTTLYANGINYTIHTSDWSIPLIEDGINYTLAPIVYNRTDGNGTVITCTTQDVTFDRSIPAEPVNMSPTGTLSVAEQTFTTIVASENTTGATLLFVGTNPGSQSYEMTNISDDTYTVTISNIPKATYSYKINVTDGLNSTMSAISTFTIDTTPSTGGRRAAAVAVATGQGLTREGAARGLAIAEASGGGMKLGLKKAQIAIQRETQASELKKTGVGLGLGAVVGGGVGLIGGPFAPVTVPAGIVLGGLIGGGIGVAK